MELQTEIQENPDGAKVEYVYFPPEEAFLERILRDLFENYWSKIVFGPCIQGSVFEIQAERPPKRISLMDGYLTVDLGSWHFHLCIGEHRGTSERPVPPDLASWRRVGKAALFRYLNRAGSPHSWGLRLWNGRGEQMITLFLPNPYLSDKMKWQKKPDWSRLNVWNHLRTTHLDLPAEVPDPNLPAVEDPHG